MKTKSQDTRKMSFSPSGKTPVLTVEKTIGDTTYIVDYEISTNARESAYDKVKKLILNDAGSLKKCQAS